MCASKVLCMPNVLGHTRTYLLFGKNFWQCSDDVKCLLFKAYCSICYCIQMWIDFSKEKVLKVAF